MNYEYEKIGERIKTERKKLRMTQEAFAEKYHVKRSTVSKWEHGEAMPNFQTMLDICADFNCELGYLLCENGYENKTRETTDICKATGLSEKAVSILSCRNKVLNGKENLLADFTSLVIEKGKTMYEGIEDYNEYATSLKELEASEDWKIIEQTFNEIEFQRKTLATQSIEEDVFYTQLEKKLNGSTNATTAIREKQEVMNILRNKAFSIERLNDINRSYQILKAKSNFENFKFGISYAFMNIVADYVKKGVEDGRKNELQEKR